MRVAELLREWHPEKRRYSNSRGSRSASIDVRKVSSSGLEDNGEDEEEEEDIDE